MIKKFLALTVTALFIFSTVGAFAAQSTNEPVVKPMEQTKDRVSRAMNNIFCGPIEVPANLDETKTKGTPIDRCTAKTKSGVERGIARIFGGLWQLATFWYSDPGCVTSASQVENPGAASAPAPVTPAPAPATTTTNVK